jgi:uncharacterized membrane protein YhiD involved in acid resistance
VTAAVGIAVGLGGPGIAIAASILMWIILSVLGRIEARLAGPATGVSTSTR